MNLPNPSFVATLPGVEYFPLGQSPAVFFLEHQVIEPYAVDLVLSDDTVWKFERNMLRDGMVSAVGEGNVRVFPLKSDPTLVGIAVHNGQHDHVLVTKKEHISYFLTRIEHFSPSDANYDDDIDEELRSLLS